jgi:hypothetical protein
MDDLGKLTVVIEGDNSDLIKILSESETATKTAAKIMADAFDQAGTVMSEKITQPVLKAGIAIEKTGTDFFDTMLKTEAVFNKSAISVVRWGQTTLETYALAKKGAFDMTAKYDDMAISMRSIFDNAAQTFGKIAGLDEALEGMTESFKEATKNAVAAARDEVKKFPEDIEVSFEDVPDIISDNLAPAAEKMLLLGTEMLTSFKTGLGFIEDEVSKYYLIALQALTDFSLSIEANKYIAIDATTLASQEVTAPFGAMPEIWYELGVQTLKGFQEGFESQVDAMIQAAISAAKKITAAYKKYLDINSPSGVFRDIGKNTMLGYKIGFIDETKKVTDEVGKSSSHVIRAFEQGQSRAAKGMTGFEKSLSHDYSSRSNTNNFYGTINNQNGRYGASDLRSLKRLFNRQAAEIVG